MKKSIFGRSIELAKLGVKIGIKELQSGDMQNRIKQARLITQSLGQLKGAAQKAGQLLSLELDDYFPPEAIEILSQLQNKGSTIPFNEIEKILFSELGPDHFNYLQEIDKKPIASASIAQIHKALLIQNSNKLSQPVVIKVQHPGVADSIDSDIALLKNLVKSFCLVTQRSMDLDPVFAEFRNMLKQEVDFLQETEFLQLYQKHILSLNQARERTGILEPSYFVPTVFEKLSTKKVIVMSLESGQSLNDWLLESPPIEDRLTLAHLILNLYCHEFFQWGLVQTDPNFSNFLIRKSPKDGVGLVLLDFGATRRYSDDFVKKYKQLLLTVQGQNQAKIIENAIQMELLDPRESESAQLLFIKMMNLAVEPFLGKKYDQYSTENTFQFADKEYNDRSKKVIKEFLKELKYTPPPHNLIFLHRKLGGIFSLLRRLNIELNLRPYWQEMIGKSE